MSILITGMAMPKGRPVCIVIDAAGQARRYDLNHDRYADDKLFEAIPVPPHGRLIDADALKQKIFSEPIVEDADDPRFNLYAKVQVAGAINKIIEAVDDAPTIIPAEEVE